MAAAGLAILGLANVQLHYLRHAGRETLRSTFSTAVYGLIDHCRASGAKCVSLEWGSHNQLLASLGSADRAAYYREEDPLDPTASYVTFVSKIDPAPSSVPDWESRLAREGWLKTLRGEIGSNGIIVYRIYGIARREVE